MGPFQICTGKLLSLLSFFGLVNSLPNDKILDVTKLKAFSDDNLNIAKMTIFLIDRVKKKTTGKRTNCWLPAFSPFPPVFSKALFFRVVKNRDCLVKSFKHE